MPTKKLKLTGQRKKEHVIISFDEKEDLVIFNMVSRLKITQQTRVCIELVEYVKSHMWKMQMTSN